jgi:hypothetical protein
MGREEGKFRIFRLARRVKLLFLTPVTAKAANWVLLL